MGGTSVILPPHVTDVGATSVYVEMVDWGRQYESSSTVEQRPPPEIAKAKERQARLQEALVTMQGSHWTVSLDPSITVSFAVAAAVQNEWASGATQAGTKSTSLANLMSDIRQLAHMPSDRSFRAPAPSTVLRAEEWAKQAMAIFESVGPWATPSVTASGRGEVVFEWWNDERKLTVYVPAAGNVSYVKVWGLDVETEMEDGELPPTSRALGDLWAWLQNS